MALPDLSDHRINPAPLSLRAERGLPAVTEGASPFRGIVEEAWPSLEHVTDPMLFYCGDGDPERMNANVTTMIEEINAFVDLSTLRSVTMSEWILKS